MADGAAGEKIQGSRDMAFQVRRGKSFFQRIQRWSDLEGAQAAGQRRSRSAPIWPRYHERRSGMAPGSERTQAGQALFSFRFVADRKSTLGQKHMLVRP